MKYIFKKSIVLLASPFILLTGCNKIDKNIKTSLTTSELEYFNNSSNYENKDEQQILNMVCNNHGLYQVNEIIHYDIDNEYVYSIKEKYMSAIKSYNSILNAFEDYSKYEEYFNITYNEETNKKLKQLFNLYHKYLYAFYNDNSFNVYNSYEKIETLINEFTLNEILYLKFNKNIDYRNINALDNSPLCNLINNDDIDYKIKMLYDILYSKYELDENGLKEPFVSAYDSLYIKVEQNENTIETNEKTYVYRMDSDGILWKE